VKRLSDSETVTRSSIKKLKEARQPDSSQSTFARDLGAMDSASSSVSAPATGVKSREESGKKDGTRLNDWAGRPVIRINPGSTEGDTGSGSLLCKTRPRKTGSQPTGRCFKRHRSRSASLTHPHTTTTSAGPDNYLAVPSIPEEDGAEELPCETSFLPRPDKLRL
jgi:hypothetical protein